MSYMLLAAFDDRERADRAVAALEEHGYTAKDISVITQEERTAPPSHTGENVASGTVGGAATGGAIGGIAGLLAGAGVLPGLVGLLIGGPIAVALGATGIVATTVSGVVTGAVAGGLIGALTSLGVSEENARYYDSTISHGGVVVAVPVREGSEEARQILESEDAEHVSSVQTAD